MLKVLHSVIQGYILSPFASRYPLKGYIDFLNLGLLGKAFLQSKLQQCPLITNLPLCVKFGTKLMGIRILTMIYGHLIAQGGLADVAGLYIGH